MALARRLGLAQDSPAAFEVEGIGLTRFSENLIHTRAWAQTQGEALMRTPVGQYLDKHLVAPVEGVSGAIGGVLRAAMGEAFNQAQQRVPPLALLSQPALGQTLGLGPAAKALLKPMATLGDLNAENQRAALAVREDPLGAVQQAWDHLDKKLINNPKATREDVRQYFEAFTYIAMGFPARAVPSVVSAAHAARASMPAAALLAEPATSALPLRLITDKAPVPAWLDALSARSIYPALVPPSELLPKTPLTPPQGQWVQTGVLRAVNDESPTLPPEKTRVTKVSGPAYLGVGPDFFSGIPGIDHFVQALKLPPSERLPTHAGLRDGPGVHGASEPTWHRFEDIWAPAVVDLREALPLLEKLNYSGYGAPASFQPLPVPRGLFPDNVGQLYDSRWFRVHWMGNDLVVKAIGNNTFHVGADGVLRYYVADSQLQNPAYFTTVAGIINHFGAQGRVSNITAVQTYTRLSDGKLARPFTDELGDRAWRWFGVSSDDVAAARAALKKNPEVEPSPVPSHPMALADKADQVFGIAKGIAHSEVPMGPWQMNHPLMVEAITLGPKGDQPALALTFGRVGHKQPWAIPSLLHANTTYQYWPGWAVLGNAFPPQLARQLPTNIFDAIDTALPKPWRRPQSLAEGHIEPRRFTLTQEQGALTLKSSSEYGSVQATLKDGVLTYATDVKKNDSFGTPLGIDVDQVRENMLTSLLEALAERNAQPTPITVKLVDSDADFWVYRQALGLGQSEAQAVSTTTIGQAMRRVDMAPQRVFVSGPTAPKPVVRIQFVPDQNISVFGSRTD